MKISSFVIFVFYFSSFLLFQVEVSRFEEGTNQSGSILGESENHSEVGEDKVRFQVFFINITQKNLKKRNKNLKSRL